MPCIKPKAFATEGKKWCTMPSINNTRKTHTGQDMLDPAPQTAHKHTVLIIHCQNSASNTTSLVSSSYFCLKFSTNTTAWHHREMLVMLLLPGPMAWQPP